MIRVSVIIPAYNAEKTIGRCLHALMNQDYPEKYEVIVVDDGSTEDTPNIVKKFKAHLVTQENSGPAAARNRGAAEAGGDVLLFTDSDCEPQENWISEMIKPFRNHHEIVGVKGAYRSRQKEIVARFIQLEYEDKYSFMRRDRYIDFIDTYSAGFRKDVFLKMDGYDTEFPVACAEDIELSYRISNKGYKMFFNPDAIVFHMHPTRLVDYLKKKQKFAYWRMLAVKKNPNKMVKDSHTPQMMKFQLLFPPAIIATAVFELIYRGNFYLTFSLLILFMLTALRFTIKALKGDLIAGMISPILLFLRAAAQFWGVSRGIIYNMRKTFFPARINSCKSNP